MKAVFITTALYVCLHTGLFAQENKFELGAAVTGNFTKSTTGNGVTRSADDRAGVGANFRYWFTGRQGMEVSWSYTNLFNRYTTGANAFAFKTHTNEATAAYVLRLPTWSKHVQPFLLAGGGALTFSPSGDVFGADTVAKATFTYGGGVDAYLTKKLGFRAQYKGFVFGSPDGLPGYATSTSTHMAQPSAGLFWRF